jgi:ribosomal protein S27AE
MGSSTDAHCYNCGYDVFLMLGGGMSNYTTYAAWPVTCNNCHAVTTANFKQLPLSCTKCESTDVLAFDSAESWKGDGETIESWGELRLTSGHYRCPRCGEHELRFGTNAGGREHIILWD